MWLMRIVGAGGLRVRRRPHVSCGGVWCHGDDHMLARRSVQEWRSQDGDRREVVEIGGDAARRVTGKCHMTCGQQMFLSSSREACKTTGFVNGVWWLLCRSFRGQTVLMSSILTFKEQERTNV